MKLFIRLFICLSGLVLINQASFGEPQNNTIAITNVTVIDGNGGKPLKNATVIVKDGRISSVATRGASVPKGAHKVDGSGKYLLPGFIDSNVHTSLYGNSKRRETVVKYGERNDELSLEFAQRQLKHGVTTIRDSYGSLLPVMKTRDAINAGKAIGPRILAAGNIVGWGGPFSLTFSMMQESELTLFQQKWNDSIALGAGEDLADMTPEELRVAINKYLDLGPNFIKYGGTAHFRTPSLIGFSTRQQRVIVEETHKRGLIAETHATSSESLRMAVEAGIDFIQHPEILSRDYPEYLVKMIVDKGVLCGIRSNTFIGKPLKDHLRNKKAAEVALRNAPPPKSGAEQRAREDRLGKYYDIQLRNAKRLIKAGCIVSIATDNYQGKAPEFRTSPKPAYQEAGSGSILAIEGLVALGMSEMEAITAGTKNGAIAAGGLDDFGTVEKGKAADLVLLNKNPLDDIKNIRALSMVMMGGNIIDIDALPEKRIFYTGK